MARYGREYWRRDLRGRRYDVGYGAGGYPRGRVRRIEGDYGGDYGGVAYRWGAGGFFGGPRYADPSRSRWFGSGRYDAGIQGPIQQGQRGRRRYSADYGERPQGGYRDRDVQGAARAGDTPYDGGYLPEVPGLPWGTSARLRSL